MKQGWKVDPTWPNVISEDHTIAKPCLVLVEHGWGWDCYENSILRWLGALFAWNHMNTQGLQRFKYLGCLLVPGDYNLYA